eukprot:m.194359 g.194359  ORF g.194359 m.194359 type:complete len:101 (-) comp16789_c2_seq2:2831-3133(-)
MGGPVHILQNEDLCIEYLLKSSYVLFFWFLFFSSFFFLFVFFLFVKNFIGLFFLFFSFVFFRGYLDSQDWGKMQIIPTRDMDKHKSTKQPYTQQQQQQKK